jgi:hypothetical protein
MGGKLVIVGDGTAQELAELEARAAREAADTAQGYCPVHRTLMRPADMERGELLAGRCGDCGKYWWYDTRNGRVGSMPDHDPATGDVILPWQAGRG